MIKVIFPDLLYKWDSVKIVPAKGGKIFYVKLLIISHNICISSVNVFYLKFKQLKP